MDRLTPAQLDALGEAATIVLAGFDERVEAETATGTGMGAASR